MRPSTRGVSRWSRGAELRHRTRRMTSPMDEPHFSFGFVPATAFTRRCAVRHPPAKLSDTDRASAWTGTPFSGSLIESLDKVSSAFLRLGDGHLRWGDRDACFIDVFFEGIQLVNVSVMLNLRAPSLEFVSGVALVANHHQWLAVTADGRVFRPTVRRFMMEIQNTPAFHWACRTRFSFAARRSVRNRRASRARVSPPAIGE